VNRTGGFNWKGHEKRTGGLAEEKRKGKEKKKEGFIYLLQTKGERGRRAPKVRTTQVWKDKGRGGPASTLEKKKDAKPPSKKA